MASANSDISTSGGFYINYRWMNAIINKTPVKADACPIIETDIYGSGFKVARQKSFYGSLGLSGSKWFPANSQWASVGIGPVKDSFGIYFTDIDKLDELKEVKEKRLPDNYEELQNWKVADSAYWESQGGVSFYIGTGISPVEIGIFAVATGGWANYLQKTGPNKVYVEVSKKKIRSISLSAGLGIPGIPAPIRTPAPSIALEKSFENSKGFAYEFTLDNQLNIEAFERFMAGDATKAQELSKVENSGVAKISDMTDSRVGIARSFGFAVPYIPILSFKASVEHAYDHVEEKSVWDEDTMKDTGVYIKQRNSFIVGQQFKEARSFLGGRILKSNPGIESENHESEKLYGNFKYSYQSNWGQERRLRKYISKVKAVTGLVQETCARVPTFKDSLGFNQVELELKLSDEYVRELIGFGHSEEKLLKKIKFMALQFQAASDASNSGKKLCQYNENDKYDDNCTTSDSKKINHIFGNLEEYSLKMNKSLNTDRKEFAKNLAKFGEEVWKSPFVFKAFYEKGKVCGQEFKYEISGQRLTRHLIDQKFINTPECSN
jgi:hypothetical protein